MCDLRLEDARLVVCTHAHTDHCGQAATHRGAGRLRGVDAPQPRAPGPHGRGSRGGIRTGAWRSPARAACPRSPCAARRPSAASAGSGIAGPIEPDRDLVDGVSVEHRPGRVDRVRDARPRALARLPVPARAAPADLRRPPAGAHLAVLRLRLLARPGGRIPGLAGRRRAARRAPVPGRARAHVRRRARPHQGQPRARGRTSRARAARPWTDSRGAPSSSFPTCTATRSRRRTPTGCCRRCSASSPTCRRSARCSAFPASRSAGLHNLADAHR